ncbi:conserved hypothetical protein [Histoplasma capsulatum G186AR]|uniref:Fe2OG dioxygenase domain-containing protein n=1 Tax=Ajellomyces capsulatus (strain G186AR / H82 / ATCC MYA-2454 / RMSCC 2432) TaxID=447093 RepID=C0NFM4_AJECG|nr:uncharacterized protein HCBG_01690 [Histoplasma capsulatum G186AR]EEH10045.1 conserved hypothetical protein [Histoplasma capsulatum G186AR]
MTENKLSRAAPVQLPVINISEATPTVGKAMIDAATKNGFFYVDSSSSDFSNADVENAFAMGRDFFASPYEEKAAVAIGTNNKGWSGMHAETLDPEHQQALAKKRRFRAMNIHEFKENKAQQELPKSLVPHEAELARFIDLCRKTCNRILTLLAIGLDIPENWFTSRHDPVLGPSGCTLRFLYYPSIDSPASSTFKHGIDVRAGAHSDYGSITLLFQRDGQPGLEILTSTGEWAPVPVRPITDGGGGATAAGSGKGAIFPPILINIGDLLSYWTAGLLKSTVHRVVFPQEDQQQQQDRSDRSRDRYSIAYFCHPVDHTELVPVPSQLVEERIKQNTIAAIGQRQRLGNSNDAGDAGEAPLTAREHLAGRLAATYGGSKEEYQ